MANNLERVLRLMAEKNASDVYMSANTPILIKIQGQILQLSDQLLSTHQTRQLLSEMLAPQQLEELDDTGELALCSGSERRVSASNCPRCSWPSGASVISFTFPPSLLIASIFRISG